MPTIREEQGVPEDTQLGEFFDFNGATEPQVDTMIMQDSGFGCSPHPGDSSHSHDSALDSNEIQPAADQTEYAAEDYTKFSNWIPRFVQPDEPCDYCRIRNLQCYLSYGKLTCTACDTLFRSCSFARHDRSDSVPSDMGVLDTLHPVTEDVTQEHGEFTGTRVLRSKNVTADDKKSNPRFSRAAVKVLKDWIESHQENPYPTEDEKAELGRLTGLRYGQINTWLANARRRGKAGRGRPKGTTSPGPRRSSPVGIPSSASIEVMNWENMNPLERWKHSPPMNEPAPFTAIKDALNKNELPPLESASPSTLGYTGFGSSREESGSHSISNKRAPSMTSLEQLTSHSAHSASSSAAWSGSHDSFGSFSSFGSGLNGKRDRRRRRKGAPALLKKKPEDKTKRIFQCTFCTDTFKSKYDWTRHEKTLHLSLEKFICCPLGPITTDPTTGDKICAYCLFPNPTSDHLETHGHQVCVEKGFEARTFYRKDHLRQHLRLMHNSQLLPHMEAWKVEANIVNSRCGFCAQRFNAWHERADHIAAHFKDGRKMIEWKGCRGLDPSVAATVLNAMPPYMIGIEQASPNPFSATSPWRCMTVSNHLQSGGAPATCWEILTVRLGRFAKEQSDKGVLLTDELLQNQARLILYDDPDPWNQTPADNPEWLDLFKRAHGLDYIPSAVGGEGKNIPEDLELYGDLGVRIPFSVQLKQGKEVPTAAATFLKEVSRRREEQQQTRNNNATLETTDGERYARHTALVIPHEKAKQFETIPAPYPETGVRGPIQYTGDLTKDIDFNQPEYLSLLSMTGEQPSPSEDQAAFDRIKQRYSSLAIPADKANQFETVPAPYPESGVRGPVYNTRDQFGETGEYNQADLLCLLGLHGQAPDDHMPTSQSNSNSNAGFASLHQSSSSSSDLTQPTPSDLLPGGGGGALNFARTINTSHPLQPTSDKTPQDQTCAQNQLSALNAFFADATTTANATTTAEEPPCCVTEQCTHQAQILSHLGFGASDNDFNHPTAPAAAGHTAASFLDPVGLDVGWNHQATMDAGVSNTLPAAGGVDASKDVHFGGEDVSMGDFDFNDLHFENDANFGEIDFDLFDTPMDQYSFGF